MRGPNTAEKADPKQRATFEELLHAGLYGQEATRRVPVRKGLLFNGEVLAKIEAVPWELEGKRERQHSQPDEQLARQRFDM